MTKSPLLIPILLAMSLAVAGWITLSAQTQLTGAYAQAADLDRLSARLPFAAPDLTARAAAPTAVVPITDTARFLASVREQKPRLTASFTRDDGLWTAPGEDGIVRFYENLAYHLRVPPRNERGISVSSATKATDFLLEVSAQQVAGPPQSAHGLVFRYRDKDNYYFFSISGDGSFALDAWVDGRRDTIIPPTAAAAIRTGQEAENRLGVLAQGSDLSLLANDEVLATVADAAPQRGRIGLGVETYQKGGVEVAFDDLALWVLGSPANEAAGWQSELANLAGSVPAHFPSPATPEPPEEEPIDLTDPAAIRATKPTYSDDFGEDKDLIVNPVPDVISTSYDGNAYNMAVDFEVGGWNLIDVEAGDFLLEIDAAHTGGSEYSYAVGLLFRFLDENNYYQFQVRADGTYALAARVDGDWKEIVERTKSSAIHKGEGASNRLGVLASGPSITLFVNDKAVQSAEDDALTNGRIGLTIDTTQAQGVGVAFDNLHLWELQPGHQGKPTPVPTGQPAPTPTEKPLALDQLPLDWRALEPYFDISNRRLEEVLEPTMAVAATYVVFEFESVAEIARPAYSVAFIDEDGEVEALSPIEFRPDPSVSPNQFAMFGRWKPGVFGTARFELPEDALEYKILRIFKVG